MTPTVRIAIDTMQLYPMALIVCWTPRYVIDILNIAGVQVFSDASAVAAVVQSFNILHGSLIAVIFFWKSSEARKSWAGAISGALSRRVRRSARGTHAEDAGVTLPNLTEDEDRYTSNALHLVGDVRANGFHNCSDIENLHGSCHNAVGTPGPSPRTSASISSQDAAQVLRMHEALSAIAEQPIGHSYGNTGNANDINVINHVNQIRTSFGVDCHDF